MLFQQHELALTVTTAVAIAEEKERGELQKLMDALVILGL